MYDRCVWRRIQISSRSHVSCRVSCPGRSTPWHLEGTFVLRKSLFQKRDGCVFWSNLHCPHDLFKVSTPMCFAYLLLVLEVHTDLWATHLRWKAQSRPEPLHTMGYSPVVESPFQARATHLWWKARSTLLTVTDMCTPPSSQ